jgi:hypothetical protein
MLAPVWNWYRALPYSLRLVVALLLLPILVLAWLSWLANGRGENLL